MISSQNHAIIIKLSGAALLSLVSFGFGLWICRRQLKLRRLEDHFILPFDILVAALLLLIVFLLGVLISYAFFALRP